MIDLVLTILCSTSILMMFKILEKLKIKLFPVIIINYAVASIFGGISTAKSGLFAEPGIWQMPWFPVAIFVGICFIAMFFLMGISTQKAGLVATSISTRMSVVIPIVFSILFYHETLNLLKFSGVMLALTALVCSLVKTPDEEIRSRQVYLPAILFFGMGTLHIIIKYTQQAYLTNGQSGAFTGTLFFFAFVSGIILSVARRVPIRIFFQKNVLLAGIVLGSCNFGTVFFLVNALNQAVFDSSIIFGVNATGIVACSVLAAAVIFKEQLSKLNWTGVALSLVSIILLFQT